MGSMFTLLTLLTYLTLAVPSFRFTPPHVVFGFGICGLKPTSTLETNYQVARVPRLYHHGDDAVWMPGQTLQTFKRFVPN